MNTSTSPKGDEEPLFSENMDHEADGHEGPSFLSRLGLHGDTR